MATDRRASGQADAGLIEACIVYATSSAGARGTRGAVSGQVPGDDAGHAGAKALQALAALPATTMDGHRARAAAFVLWDEGDLLGRARVNNVLEEMLLGAILADLVLS